MLQRKKAMTYVRGKTVWADAHFIALLQLLLPMVLQPTAYHPPAYKSLRGTQRKQSTKALVQLFWQLLAEHKVNQRYSVDETHCSAKHSVAILPPEYTLELFHRLRHTLQS